MKTRLFELVMKCDYMDEGELIKGIERCSYLDLWFYIKHDKDKYKKEDEEKNKEHKEGELKPPHWHFYGKLKDSTDSKYIAKHFGVPENFINKVKGGWGDVLLYSTHRNRPEKHQYEDEEIKSNFDFVTERDKYERKKNGNKLSDRQIMGNEIMMGKITLREVREKDPYLYMDNIRFFTTCRMDYLNNLPTPPLRLNYYICGSGGVGKGLFSRGVSRLLFPNLEYDNDIFFEIGGDNVTFEGYDGQPVIIWNDCRSVDLLNKLGGRENVFNVFDPHPTKQKQNIKYGSVNLPNVVNIVNSVQSYEEFLDSLAGEYVDKNGNSRKSEDKNQSYRRFPLITELKEEYFNLYINKGFYENSGAFREYITYEGIRGNLQKIVFRCGGEDSSLYREITRQTLKQITDKHEELINRQSTTEIDEDKIREEFKDYGNKISPDGFSHVDYNNPFYESESGEGGQPSLLDYIEDPFGIIEKERESV